jgi:N-acetylmuramic acid 6-phosphate etherase
MEFSTKPMTMTTEQPNPNSTHIDNLSSVEMMTTINQEDAKVAKAIETVIPQIALAVDAITEALRNGGRLIYVGAGTSGRLGILDAVECVPTFSTSPDLVRGIIAGGEGALVNSVEGAEDHPEDGKRDLINRNLTEKDVVCGIAASGRTPYVIGALNYAKELNAKTIAIACNVPSPILEIADIPIGVEVGPEVITGSTRMKSGTAQKMVLNMLSTGTMVKLGKVYGNLMVDVKVTNQKLAIRARRLVMHIAEVDEQTAQALLDQSNNEVKTAIVMHKRNVTVDIAHDLLHQANGLLGEVIGHQPANKDES